MSIISKLKEILDSSTYARENPDEVIQTNLIFFYGGCKVMHHADFLQVRKGTVASF